MAEFMLEWAADQATEITNASIEVEFGDAAEQGREVPTRFRHGANAHCVDGVDTRRSE